MNLKEFLLFVACSPVSRLAYLINEKYNPRKYPEWNAVLKTIVTMFLFYFPSLLTLNPISFIIFLPYNIMCLWFMISMDDFDNDNNLHDYERYYNCLISRYVKRRKVVRMRIDGRITYFENFEYAVGDRDRFIERMSKWY